MLIRRYFTCIPAVTIIHCVSSEESKEIDQVPIPEEFFHIAVPTKVNSNFRELINVPFYYDECECYMGEISEDYPFNSFVLFLDGRKIISPKPSATPGAVSPASPRRRRTSPP